MSSSMIETRQADTPRPPARDEQRWQAVQRRDPAFDGKFLFAVRTTGVYCRPSCASRPAKRENVTFFPTVAEAEKAAIAPASDAGPTSSARPIRKVEAVKQACERIGRPRKRPSSPSSRRARA